MCTAVWCRMRCEQSGAGGLLLSCVLKPVHCCWWRGCMDRAAAQGCYFMWFCCMQQSGSCSSYTPTRHATHMPVLSDGTRSTRAQCLTTPSAHSPPPPPSPSPPQVGLRYSSPTFTAGTIMQPRSSCFSELWAVGRMQGLTLGVQLKPDCTLSELRQHLLGRGASSSGLVQQASDADKQTLQALAQAASTPLPGSEARWGCGWGECVGILWCGHTTAWGGLRLSTALYWQNCCLCGVVPRLVPVPMHRTWSFPYARPSSMLHHGTHRRYAHLPAPCPL